MAATPSLLSRMSLAGLILVLWSCASSPELDIVLGESQRGAVYLERIPDRSFQAAHPIKIGQDTVARILMGIIVKEDQGLLRNLMTGQASLAPAFTEEEVRYLAPLITEGFVRAASDQQVGFRVIRPGSGWSQSVGAGVGSSEPSQGLSSRETSRGSMYAYGRSLYVTLTELRVRAERADTINMANRRVPDPTGFAHRTVLFTPESAQRPDTYRGEATLAIDYELLATLPADTSTPAGRARSSTAAAPPAATADSTDSDTDSQLRLLQKQMRQKNHELEELRKELQDIRRHLTEPSPRP